MDENNYDLQGEQYRESIVVGMTAVETSYEVYIKQKLLFINKQIREGLLTPQEAGKDVAVLSSKEFKKMFETVSFEFNVDQLAPALNIGVEFATENIIKDLLGSKINPIQLQAQFGLDFNPPTVKFIDILNERGGYLNHVLEKSTLDRLNKIIEEGIRDGLSYNEIGQLIQEDTFLGIDSSYRANMIARTEANRAMNEGQRRYMKGLGIERYNIIPASSACPLCVSTAYAINDEVNSYKDYNVNEVDILPIHPSCRCVIVAVIPEEWYI